MAKTPRTLRRLTIPNLLAIEALWLDLRSRPNVVGYYVGQKLAKKRRTRRLALVVCVSEKIAWQKLSKRDRLPPDYWVPLGRDAGIQVPIDVQVVGESGRQQASAGPGDGFIPPTMHEARATIGVAVEHPSLGRVVTTAGHAVRPIPGVQVFNDGTAPSCGVVNVAGSSEVFDSTVRKVLWTDDVESRVRVSGLDRDQPVRRRAARHHTAHPRTERRGLGVVRPDQTRDAGDDLSRRSRDD